MFVSFDKIVRDSKHITYIDEKVDTNSSDEERTIDDNGHLVITASRKERIVDDESNDHFMIKGKKKSISNY